MVLLSAAVKTCSETGVCRRVLAASRRCCYCLCVCAVLFRFVCERARLLAWPLHHLFFFRRVGCCCSRSSCGENFHCFCLKHACPRRPGFGLLQRKPSTICYYVLCDMNTPTTSCQTRNPSLALFPLFPLVTTRASSFRPVARRLSTDIAAIGVQLQARF